MTFSFKTFSYHVSFFVFVSLTAIALVGSAAGLVAQAWLSGGQRRWNIVIVVGCYVVLGILSGLFAFNRMWSMRSSLAMIPRAYIPVKQDDVPHQVSQLIESEYIRACLVSYIVRPRGKVAPGWGALDTDLENIYLPRALLDTLPALDSAARKLLPTLPPLRPHVPVAHHLAPLVDMLRGQKFHEEVEAYDELIRRARFYCAGGEGEDITTDAEYREGVRISKELERVFSALSVLRHPHPTTNGDERSRSPVLDILSKASFEGNATDGLLSGASSF